MRNLRDLRELGVYGRYGFFEAVDFTAERVGAGSLAVTRSYMAHHIGMSMVASCNALFKNRMQERFMRDPYMRSAEEFLQEKIAKNTVVYEELKESGGRSASRERPQPAEKAAAISPQAPRCSLLTNGEITDVLTDTGAGFMILGGDDLTRRGGDLLRRAQGFFAFARLGGEFIPFTRAPLYEAGIEYSMEQEPRSVSYYAKKGKYGLGMRCMVHPTISCEQRQLVIKNGYSAKKRLQLLLYFEPVLSQFKDYNAHPAYSKLFVTSRYDPASKTLVFSRRNRDSSRDMFLTAGFLREELDFSFETLRENLMAAPNGFEGLRNARRENFKNGSGVPDSCGALLLEAELAPNARFEATVLLAASRTEAEGIAAIVSMRKMGGLEPQNAALSPLQGDSLEGRLGGAMLGQLLFTHAACEENAEHKLENRLGQSGLWPLGISGDLPIALMELEEGFDEATAVCYIRMHASLRALGVEFDLCAILHGPNAAITEERLSALLQKHGAPGMLDQRGGVFLLRESKMTAEALVLVRATARHTATGAVSPAPAREYAPLKMLPVSPAPLPQGEGCLAVSGGTFSGGAFYAERKTPLPFCHVLANPVFGTLVSDSALGCTWAVNSRENKLTPWYNDICTDNTGELLLLKTENECRDLIKGSRAAFSPGQAVYAGRAGDVHCEVKVTVAEKGFCKHIDIKLVNKGPQTLTGELAYYIEPVLHVDRTTARHIVSRERDNALLLYNPYNTAVRCYAAMRGGRTGEESEDALFTNDRTAFLCGDWRASALEPNNDPCAAVILPVSLTSGEEAAFRFALTYGASEPAALHIYEPATSFKQKANEFTVITPDKHLNEYINHFAPWQILSARLLGRCAFYQCGGAYGFRDQLQDVSAYLAIDPALARRHIVRCCAAQFEEGDVAHWWHPLPKSGGGIKAVRTRFSDDLAWLPFVCAEYVEKTGDTGILNIQARYLSAETLKPGEHERYMAPARSRLSEDVFSHCVKALEKSHNRGENGLPLIGSGAWNDGFSSVGLRGRGTSVWLALFLALVNTKFAALCEKVGKKPLAEKLLAHADALKEAVDRFAWDGAWYLRAFYDNGARMGSHESGECRIDLLPQSFAVFAGMPDKDRVQTALKSAMETLVDEKLRLVRLFERPFQNGVEQPGYVKAYPAGLRENGGQYTHAAVWFAISLLESGKAEEGWRLLEMLNPANRAAHPELGAAYKIEPYYMAADIYTNPNAAGRGGWSIYTGAASWYYRAVLENLMGLKLHGETAEITPRLPQHWKTANMKAKIRGTTLDISYRPAYGQEPGTLVDGVANPRIPLDGHDHTVEVLF
jgi:cyclic beta-1,2-glucan synthetase